MTLGPLRLPLAAAALLARFARPFLSLPIAMKRNLLSLFAVVACASLVCAQDPIPLDQSQLDSAALGAEQASAVNHAPPAAMLAAPVAAREQQQFPLLTPTTITPEMWVYSQEMRRYDDPAQAVRRKAEERSAQRMSRISAMKWYGMSNSRPQAAIGPMMGGLYSPTWIGNGRDRYEWVGNGWPVTTERIEKIIQQR
jgi:hypothetical protein